MAAPHPLVADLRALRDLFRRHVSSHRAPTLDACRELTAKLGLMAEAAAALADRAAMADELEAIARDLDLIAKTTASPAFQELLKAEQRALQTRLDAVPKGARLPRVPFGSTPAELAASFGDTTVVSFPRAPRLRPSPIDCQGDDGDAA